MRNTVNITTKSDIVHFIILKRKLRYIVHKICVAITLAVAVLCLSLCIHYRGFFIQTFKTIGAAISPILTAKPTSTTIFFDKKTNIDVAEQTKILTELQKHGFNRNQLKLSIDTIKQNNRLISDIYVRNIIATNEIKIFVKEKPILAFLLKEETSGTINANNIDKIITADGEIVPYRRPAYDINNKIKISGFYDRTVDLLAIIKTLQKHHLEDKVSYLKFYSNKRFDIFFKNGLSVKLPKKDWRKAISLFVKTDNEYVISDGFNNVKYIDLRTPGRIVVSTK